MWRKWICLRQCTYLQCRNVGSNIKFNDVMWQGQNKSQTGGQKFILVLLHFNWYLSKKEEKHSAMHLNRAYNLKINWKIFTLFSNIKSSFYMTWLNLQIKHWSLGKVHLLKYLILIIRELKNPLVSSQHHSSCIMKTQWVLKHNDFLY